MSAINDTLSGSDTTRSAAEAAILRVRRTLEVGGEAVWTAFQAATQRHFREYAFPLTASEIDGIAAEALFWSCRAARRTGHLAYTSGLSWLSQSTHRNDPTIISPARIAEVNYLPIIVAACETLAQ